MRTLLSRTVCAAIMSLTSFAAVALKAQEIQSKVGALEQQAQTYLQEKKPQLAIPLLREITSLDPQNLNAQGNLGVLLYFQGNFVEAIPHMRAALQLQPDLWRIEALLGLAEKVTGDPIKARDDLERAFSSLDEKKFRIEVGLALIELDSGAAQLVKALSVAAKLEELAPQDPRVLFVAYQISRQMMYQSLLSMMVSAPASAEMHMIMAGELGRQGNHNDSVEHYREAIRLNPATPGAHFELAEQLRTSPNPAWNRQAEEEYKAALQVNRYDELSLRQLGGILAAKGDFKTAEESYRKALALQPSDSDAKTGLAIVLISMDRKTDAVSLLESAVRDDPTNIVAHYRLSTLYRRDGRTADSDREMDSFHHYQEIKDNLGKVFKGLAAQTGPM